MSARISFNINPLDFWALSDKNVPREKATTPPRPKSNSALLNEKYGASFWRTAVAKARKK